MYINTSGGVFTGWKRTCTKEIKGWIWKLGTSWEDYRQAIEERNAGVSENSLRNVERVFVVITSKYDTLTKSTWKLKLDYTTTMTKFSAAAIEIRWRNVVVQSKNTVGRAKKVHMSVEKTG